MGGRIYTARNLADLLTVSRVLLAVGLVFLGLWVGDRALPAAVLIVVLSWFTDLLDGPLARRDPSSELTWVGQHDAEADLATSLGVVAYLFLSGYMVGWAGALIVAGTLLVWVLHSHQLAWPLYAMPYGVLVFVAIDRTPVVGWLAVVYLLATLGVRLPRLRREYLPEFFQALGKLLGRGAH
jgi:phosphatidylglycerophosphate synthase